MKKLILATAGDREMTCEEVYNQYKHALYDISKKYLCVYGFDDALQIASEALIKAYNTYDVSRGVAFTTYLYLYVNHTFKNTQRHAERHNIVDAVSLEEVIYPDKNCREDLNVEDLLRANDNTEEAAIRIIQVEALREAMEGLSAKEKAILKSYYYNDMSQGEIGKALDMGQVKVSRVIARTVRKLRVLMEVGA